jgi:hypothetical protein
MLYVKYVKKMDSFWFRDSIGTAYFVSLPPVRSRNPKIPFFKLHLQSKPRDQIPAAKVHCQSYFR